MRNRGRAACLCVSALLALAGAGCGDSGGDDAAQRPTTDAAPVLGEGLPPEAEHPAATAIDRLQRAFVDGDYDGVCAEVTRAAALQAGQAAHDEATSCKRDVRDLLEMIRDGGGWRHAGEPRVTEVEAAAGEAAAVVALDRRWRAEVPLVREGRRWRLDGLFGISKRRAEKVSSAIADADFPPVEREPVEATDGEGDPCPGLSETAYPRVSGGCVIKLSSRIAPLRILTPFGGFDFADCAVSYRVKVDSSGRTWTDELAGDGGPDADACGDVDSCYNMSIEEFVPWRGRIYADGDDAFLHRMDMCLRTCVGVFVGKLTMRMVRDGNGWRAEPVDGGGSSGFRFGVPLRAEGDLGLDAG